MSQLNFGGEPKRGQLTRGWPKRGIPGGISTGARSGVWRLYYSKLVENQTNSDYIHIDFTAPFDTSEVQKIVTEKKNNVDPKDIKVVARDIYTQDDTEIRRLVDKISTLQDKYIAAEEQILNVQNEQARKATEDEQERQAVEAVKNIQEQLLKVKTELRDAETALKQREDEYYKLKRYLKLVDEDDDLVLVVLYLNGLM